VQKIVLWVKLGIKSKSHEPLGIAAEHSVHYFPPSLPPFRANFKNVFFLEKKNERRIARVGEKIDQKILLML
jgi:hypothetical protein